MASSGDEDKINIEALGVRVECSTCNVRLGPQAMTMHLQVFKLIIYFNSSIFNSFDSDNTIIQRVLIKNDLFRENRIWKKSNIFLWKIQNSIGVLFVRFNYQAWNRLSVTGLKIDYWDLYNSSFLIGNALHIC